jgi:hypothetical protein
MAKRGANSKSYERGELGEYSGVCNVAILGGWRMAMNTRAAVAVVVVVMCGGVAEGQWRRDFYDGVGLYNPEIGVVATGPLLVVRPVVSRDLKYVTLSVQATQTQVVSIQNFPVVRFGPAGFAGGVQPAPLVNGAGGLNNRVGAGAGLNERGMRWIAPP